MSPSLLMKGKVTYCSGDLEAEGCLVRYQWTSSKRFSCGCQMEQKEWRLPKATYSCHYRRIGNPFDLNLIRQSFALCSHSIFYLILNDRTAFSVVVNHNLPVNGTLTLTAVYYALQSCYLQYTYLRFAST